MPASEIVVALTVVDEAMYDAYRAAIAPLLEAHGGRFVLDVRVSEVMRPVDHRFNRLFSIRFPSPEDRAAVFASPEYLAIRARLFEPSTRGYVQLGTFTPASDAG
jgi:uncharacterized protein (DUF1330 family)